MTQWITGGRCTITYPRGLLIATWTKPNFGCSCSRVLTSWVRSA
ncbi:hypothetical protein [Kibdelosporangium phytohabitans]|nr:hypothetical protein [Kibdelosporangium phytohabitans]MBE1462173.1 hypothetical protein [Kibdelosporangium phytohabitans]